MENWTRLVIRHRWIVVGVWIVVFVVSGIASSGLADLLTNRFTLPGTDTARAEAILEDNFGEKTTGTFSIVVRTDPNSMNDVFPEVEDAAARASDVLPTSSVAAVVPVSDTIVVASLTSKLEAADAKGYTDDIRAAVGEIPEAEVFVTGQAAIEHDLDPVFNEDLKVGELYIAIPIALVILLFVFGSLALLVPFIFAAATIPATLAIVWIFAHYMELTTYLQNLVFLIGFGIAIDYSLLVVYRYREEHREGVSKEDAVVKTMATAGRAVVFSGSAVGIGLALMLFMPLPFMRGFGIGGLAIPVVSIVAAITLLPVLLYLITGPLDRVRLLPKRITERREAEENFWVKLARAIMRRPVWFAVGTTALLLALAAPALALELGPGSNEGIPKRLESVQGLDVMATAVGKGALAPTTVVIDTGEEMGVRQPEVQDATRSFVARLTLDPEVARVDFEPSSQYIEPTGRFIRIDIVGKHEYGDPASSDFVHRLRDEIIPESGFPASAAVFAGGGPPGGVDFLDVTYSAFPWLVLGVLLLTYLLLLRAFRSLLLPLKAIVLNLLSILAAYGVLDGVLQVGPGRGDRAHRLRPDRGLDPGLRVRDGLRPLDGLRGLPRLAHARGMGQDEGQRGRGLDGAREDRPDRHRGGADHVRRVHGLRRRLRRRAAAVRLRARDRDPHRRHDRARLARAERDGALRPLELVASGGCGASFPRRAVAAPGQVRSGSGPVREIGS